MKTLKNSILAIILVAFCLSAWAQDSSVKIEPNSDIGEKGVYIGALAGESVTFKTDNTFIGHESGRSNTGHRNTYIGSNAGSEGVDGTYNTSVGYKAGFNYIGSNSVFIGAESGADNIGGGFSVFVGRAAGKGVIDKEGCTLVGAYAGKDSNAEANTFLGYAAGLKVQGWRNVIMGAYTALELTAGEENTVLGTRAAFGMTSGNRNIMVGSYAGQDKVSGDDNVYIGYESGKSNNGNSNVFIGYRSGANVTGSNQLYIENSDTTTAPLIYGDFQNDKVGINTNDVPEGYTLAVRGQVIAEEIRLMLYDDWPDYVFQPEYDMLTLEETEQQIETLGHLPGVPSAAEVGTDGIQVGEMNAILLEKIEELTLHMIDMNKEVKALRQENQTLKNRMETMINDK